MTQVHETSGFRETHDTSSRDEWVEKDSRHKFKRRVGLDSGHKFKRRVGLDS